MRFLKIAFVGLVTALAMLASLVVALGVALLGILVFLFLRLRGRPATGSFRPTSTSRPTRPTESDVIDVTATEVGTNRIER